VCDLILTTLLKNKLERYIKPEKHNQKDENKRMAYGCDNHDRSKDDDGEIGRWENEVD
jgi:hypothetical protein